MRWRFHDACCAVIRLVTARWNVEGRGKLTRRSDVCVLHVSSLIGVNKSTFDLRLDPRSES